MSARLHLGLALPVILATLPPVRAEPLSFHLTFPPTVSDKPFLGRVLVVLCRADREPRGAVTWGSTEPVFARDVRGWKPGETLVMGPEAQGYPRPLGQLPVATYSVQAVMDFDQGGRSVLNSPGTAFSKPRRLPLDPASTGPLSLTIDQVVPPRKFTDTERVKLAEVPSRLLTAFHGRPVSLRAAVILPKSFSSRPERRYPVVYEIPGFSGTHFDALGAVRREPTNLEGVEALWVMLDPTARTGHHVFADSDNNGPVGQALVEELIPAVESRFRGLGTPAARLVTGHSSGGWSSLWLQVAYPDTFGGVWSTAPDPVDFRDFQRIDLYLPGVNMFTDGQGRPRPIARRGGQVTITYRQFSDLDRILGRGGQLDSFDAVFSGRGGDGRPRPLWDRDTGAVDPEVVRQWQRYDISRVLGERWPELGPKLKGKLHAYAAANDSYYLEGAVRLLGESLKRLGSDAVVEVFPGKDHGTLLDRDLRARMNREMAAALRRAGVQ